MSGELNLSGLHQVALTCSELGAAIDFYNGILELPLLAKFEPPGLAFFDLGGVRLSIQQGAAVESSAHVLYFRVADIDAAAALLQQRGVDFEREPALVFSDEEGQLGAPGEAEWMAFFRDPDRNLLALAARRQAGIE